MAIGTLPSPSILDLPSKRRKQSRNLVIKRRHERLRWIGAMSKLGSELAGKQDTTHKGRPVFQQ